MSIFQKHFLLSFSGVLKKAPENTMINVLTPNAFTNPALASLDD